MELKSNIQWQKFERDLLHLEYAIAFEPRVADEMFCVVEKETVYLERVDSYMCGPQAAAVAYGDDNMTHTCDDGKLVAVKPWTPFLAKLRDQLEIHTMIKYNFLLIECYGTASEGNRMHLLFAVDPEPIASISLGQERNLVFTHNRPHTRNQCDGFCNGCCGHNGLVSLHLQHGSVLKTYSPTNKYWKQYVRVFVWPCGPHVMLTFRKKKKKKKIYCSPS